MKMAGLAFMTLGTLMFSLLWVCGPENIVRFLP
jgi:hypothetical protein